MASTSYRTYKDAETKLKVYRHRLDRADRDFELYKDRAKDGFNRYGNELRPDQINVVGHRVASPTGVSIIDTLHSGMTSIDVDFTVDQRGAGTREMAILAEQALSEEWSNVRAMRKVRQANKDALLAGWGWAEVGYEYAEEEGEKPRSEEAIQGDVDAILEGSVQEGITPPSPKEIAAAIPVTEKVVEVTRDRIVLDYVPWDQVRVDPDARYYEDCRWIARVQRLPVAEVQENPKFVEYCTEQGTLKSLKKLEGDSVAMNIGDEAVPNKVEPDDDRVTVVTFTDVETGTICTFARSNGDFILDESPNPFAVNLDPEDRFPMVPLILREDPRKFRGIADIEVASPGLDELNIYRSAISSHLARSVPKVAAPAGLFTNTGQATLRNREWGAVAEIEDGHSVDEFKELNVPPLDSEVYGMVEKLEASIRDATGVTDMQRGQFSQSRRSATEAAAVKEGGTNRQGEKATQMELFILRLAQRMLQLMQLFYDAPRIARIADANTEEPIEQVWVWDRKDITMENMLAVSLTPKEDETRGAKFDKATTISNMIAPLPSTDLEEMEKYLLEEAGLRPDLIAKLIKTKQEQQAEAVAQQQQALDVQQQQQDIANQQGGGAPADAGAALDPQVAAAMAGSGAVRPVMPTQ